jgi:hypothetical protein
MPTSEIKININRLKKVRSEEAVPVTGRCFAKKVAMAAQR